MFRVSEMMRRLRDPALATPYRPPPGPMVIWNLTRRCNLTCKHCYALSTDRDFPGEVSTDEALRIMDDLRACQVPVLILSGGEPLLRPDLFDLARAAKAKGFYVGLSSNGTLIDAPMAARLAGLGLDYVGISLDGMAATHDRFRRRDGAFAASLAAIRACRAVGIKVGMRFTLAEENAADLPALLDLMAGEGVEKFYLSHLNYAGRGNHNRSADAGHARTRAILDLVFDRAWDDLDATRDYVTGNNDADAAWLLLWAARRGIEADHLLPYLRGWGGNASGVHVANIDNLAHVHPDTMWWHHDLGSLRTRSFAEIWNDLGDPLMAGLKQRPRPVTGRCCACRYLEICGGNTRTRAHQVTGDYWAEDPGCYLDDAEIGSDVARQVTVTPFSAGRHGPPAWMRAGRAAQ